jgi:hypothetical protein
MSNPRCLRVCSYCLETFSGYSRSTACPRDACQARRREESRKVKARLTRQSKARRRGEDPADRPPRKGPCLRCGVRPGRPWLCGTCRAINRRTPEDIQYPVVLMGR